MVDVTKWCCIGMLVIYAFTLIAICYGIKNYLIDKGKYKSV